MNKRNEIPYRTLGSSTTWALAWAAAAILWAAPSVMEAKSNVREIDLATKDFFVRRGFSPAWTRVKPEGEGWKKVPGNRVGGRPIQISELGLPGLPERSFLSLKRNAPEDFTLSTSFHLDAGEATSREVRGLYLAIIGTNWEVYLNGDLVRGEMHPGPDGKGIAVNKLTRRVLIPLDSRLLRTGENRLVLRVRGDPADPNTGLFRGGPYLIDDLDALRSLQTDRVSLILIFLYFFVGLFHVFLFMRRPADAYNLWFGLFALCLFVFNLTRTTIVHDWFADSDWIIRGDLVFFFLMVPACGAFLNTVLQRRLGRFTLFSAAYTLVFIAIIIPTPQPFVEDVLQIWLLTTLLVPLPFYFGRIAWLYWRKTSERAAIAGAGQAKLVDYPPAALKSLITSIPGNLFVGALVLGACAGFDLLDNLIWNSGITLTRYGFFAFVAGTAMLLANRFISSQKRVEALNQGLEKNINELRETNSRLSRSEEVYRVLVEGSQDVIFALDTDWKFIKVNHAVQRQLGHKPDRLVGTDFRELLYDDPRDGGHALQLARERLDVFLEKKRADNIKLMLKSTFNAEPREFQLRLEYIEIDGKTEIQGHAQSILEDSLLKYFVSEKQRYEIGNFLLTAEDMTSRLVRNLDKYLDPAEVMGIRVSLREMIINAVEHGNLAVTYDEKTQSQLEGRYREFLKERQEDERYRDRTVQIDYLLEPGRVVYLIEDQGAGFDHKKLREKKAEDVNQEALQHGRGIMMTEQAFDEIKYNNKGNAVRLTKNFSPTPLESGD